MKASANEGRAQSGGEANLTEMKEWRVKGLQDKCACLFKHNCELRRCTKKFQYSIWSKCSENCSWIM